MEKASVTIYTSPTCAYCRQSKELFKKLEVAYNEKDVTEKSEYAEEAVQKSGQFGVPVIIIGDDLITGYDKEGILTSLKKVKVIAEDTQA